MSLFHKSLPEMVKGLRSAKNNDTLGKYVSDVMAAIKKELKSADHRIKTIAVSKLTYLNMMGYDTTWAAFSIVEVMSLSRFAYKRIGYLAAAQCFTSNTDLVLLCTNLLQKELQGKNPYAIGLAINCLANIANKDLARVLLSDLITMMSSSRVYIRKKAVLVMYKMFMCYPPGLRDAYPALKRKLSDDDPSVVSCAVNVICELACKKPKNYLPLAPLLFKLLQDSANNWMLIKIVKLFRNLMTEEPRLARKLMGPLCNIIENTDAKSLMYECVSTVVQGLPYTKKSDGSLAKNTGDIVRLCSTKLRELVQDQDQNLKYLGLVGFSHLMLFDRRAVTEQRGLVLQCLSDEDSTIRIRALDLLAGMVTQRNLEPIVERLLEHIETAEGTYRQELVQKILVICSKDRYGYVGNFAWYITILVNLARATDHDFGGEISKHLIDVVTRVEDVRSFAVRCMVPVLMDGRLMTDRASSRGSSGVRVLFAAAWIIGEYSHLLMPASGPQNGVGNDGDVTIDGDELSLVDPLDPHAEDAEMADSEAAAKAQEVTKDSSLHLEICMAMLQTRNLELPMSVQCAFVQNALKVVLAGLKVNQRHGDTKSAKDMVRQCVNQLKLFAESKHVEVQERAVNSRKMLLSCRLWREKELSSEHTDTKTDDVTGKTEEKSTSAVAENEADDEMMLEFVPSQSDLEFALDLLQPLFSEPLRPVNPKAQAAVPIPEGLDLDVWISHEEEKFEEHGWIGSSIASPDMFTDKISFTTNAAMRNTNRQAVKIGSEWKFLDAESDEDGDIMGELGDPKSPSSGSGKSTHKKRGSYSGNSRSHAGDPFYLDAGEESSGSDLDNIPMGVLSPSDLGEAGTRRKSSGSLQDQKSRKGKSSSKRRSRPRKYNIAMDDAMPEGADTSRSTRNKANQRDRTDSNGSDIDLEDIDLSLDNRSSKQSTSGANAGGKGRGRARITEEIDDDDGDSKGGKKKKKKKEKKAKKAKKEKKEKSTSKNEESKNGSGEGTTMADALISAVSEEKVEKSKKEKKKKKKKKKKSSD